MIYSLALAYCIGDSIELEYWCWVIGDSPYCLPEIIAHAAAWAA